MSNPIDAAVRAGIAAFVAVILAVLVMGTAGRPASNCPGVISLELPASNEAFVHDLRTCWAATERSMPGRDFVLGPLRPQLFADSFLLIPAYVTLLIIFSWQLGGRLWSFGSRQRQLLCILPILPGYWIGWRTG